MELLKARHESPAVRVGGVGRGLRYAYSRYDMHERPLTQPRHSAYTIAMDYIHQKAPFRVPTDDGKTIDEHFGHASAGDRDVSVARMVAPAGWSEPAQTPEFDEYTLMVSGQKEVTIGNDTVTLSAGESLFIPKGSTVRYANPFDVDAVYWSVCIPAFSPDRAHRHEE